MFKGFWGSAPPSPEGRTATACSERFVADLIHESEQVAQYRRWSGLGHDDAFWRAIADARAATPRDLSNPAILHLIGLLARRSRTIPFATLSELRKGWDPSRRSRWTNLGTLLLSMMAVGLVVLTGILTNIYNEGAAVAQALTTLEPVTARQHYSRLVRDMHQSRRQMNLALSEDEPNSEELSQFDLARNLYYDAEAEISQLSRDLTAASWASCEFQRKVLRLALREPSFCGEGSGLMGAGQVANLTDRGDYGEYSPDPNSCDAGPAGIVQASMTEGSRRSAAEMAEPTALPGSFSHYSDGLDAMVDWLMCRKVIAVRPEGYPLISTSLNDLRGTLTPLAVLILPALYGAMGATMSLMRARLEPLFPSPSLWATIHRVVFGAIAGVVLVWFVTPGAELSEQIEGIGLSLFGLTFLVGFSLDFFFGVIDRVVTTVSGSGAQRSPSNASDAEPSSPAASAERQTAPSA